MTSPCCSRNTGLAALVTCDCMLRGRDRTSVRRQRTARRALDNTRRGANSARGIGDQTPDYTYRYNEGPHLSNRRECHLLLYDAERSADYTQQSLATLDQSFARVVTLTTVDLGRAHAKSPEVDEAARLLGDAGEMVAHSSSARLAEAVKQGRAELAPWKGFQRRPQPRRLLDSLRRGVKRCWPFTR
jgi:hypothetical protein